MGVKGVEDNIVVSTAVKIDHVMQQIQDAFKRQAISDTRDIEIKVHGSTVTLKGHVRTWGEV